MTKNQANSFFSAAICLVMMLVIIPSGIRVDGLAGYVHLIIIGVIGVIGLNFLKSALNEFFVEKTEAKDQTQEQVNS